MRRIYLVRHGMPDFPNGERYCLGRTDMPVCATGRLQGCLLGRELADKRLTVFTSPLIRAKATAEFITPRPIVMDGLMESYAGDWDGLSFSVIRERWPEIFAMRGEHPDLPIPGSERAEDGQARFVSAVRAALQSCEGDIAVVAHSTVIQYLFCEALAVSPKQGRKYRLSYGSYSLLDFDGEFRLGQVNIIPHPVLDDSLCMKMLDAAGCGENIAAHCKAVSEEAVRIALELNSAGLALNKDLIRSSALLHDIARLEENHAVRGAEMLRELGYPQHADIIRQHHNIESTDINEAAVVYIADKCVSEAGYVSVAERFSRSLEKCLTDEALQAHKRRYAAALAVMNNINTICQKEIVK